MATEAGDMENLKQIPVERGFGQIGKGEYKKYAHGNKLYNDFMMKPDKKCSEQEIKLKYEMAHEMGDIDNMRQIPIKDIKFNPKIPNAFPAAYKQAKMEF